MCIQGNPKLSGGPGQLETEIEVRRLGAAESIKSSAPVIYDCFIKLEIFKMMSRVDILSTSCENWVK